MLKLFIILAIIVAAEQVFTFFLPKLKGDSGEAAVGMLLSNLPQDKYTILHNVLLKTDRGSSQIDYVVVSVFGIFIIEVKNYSGWITGSENASQWTQTIYHSKHHFMNPIHQNYGHVKAIEALINDPSVPIYPIVTFPGDCTMKITFEHSTVVKWGNLKSQIEQLSVNEVITADRMKELTDLITTSNIDSKETRKEHLQDIQKEKDNIKEGYCPRCGGKLVVRQGKYGSFLGCSNYPKCRYTKHLN
jgi:hypothetical protein